MKAVYDGNKLEIYKMAIDPIAVYVSEMWILTVKINEIERNIYGDIRYNWLIRSNNEIILYQDIDCSKYDINKIERVGATWYE